MSAIDQPAPAGVLPTKESERIAALDVVRGVAVLGILAMNVDHFALPEGSAFEAWHGGGLDLAVLTIQDVFFDGRMRGLFSMLFGAGAVLFLSRLERRGAGIRAADLYYRRMLWLLLFGLVHAWVLLWPGDILYGYALCGLFLFPLRHLSARKLVLAGLVVLGVGVPQAFHEVRGDRERWAEAQAAALESAAGEELSDEQAAALEWRDERVAEFGARIDPEERAKEIATRRGGYVDVWLDAAPQTYRSQGERQYAYGFFDQLGAMLVGMGLLATGFFAGAWRRRGYVALIAVGYGLVVPFVLFMEWEWVRTGTPPDAFGQMLVYDAAYPFARIAVALAHASVLVLLVEAARFPALLSRLAATGRMALTHYVAQTVVLGVLLFGPIGGLFGRFTRAELVPLVVGMWVLQVAVSRPWLARFRYGPLEWLWRSLTYGQRQPLRRTSSEGAPARDAGAV